MEYIEGEAQISSVIQRNVAQKYHPYENIFTSCRMTEVFNVGYLKCSLLNVKKKKHLIIVTNSVLLNSIMRQYAI